LSPSCPRWLSSTLQSSFPVDTAIAVFVPSSAPGYATNCRRLSPATVYAAVFNSSGRSRRKELEEVEVSNITVILIPCDSVFFRNSIFFCCPTIPS
jgi:hypothetical protein